MTTSSNAIPAATPPMPGALRLLLSDEAPAGGEGGWWPRSRDLQREAADLVDHFPAGVGRISRMLFSRPDWDSSSTDGLGVRSILAARGPVKVGSFPRDDTHLMILTLSSGQRLTLHVVPSDTPAVEAEEQLRAAARWSPTPHNATASDEPIDSARWDDESPAR